MFTIPDSKDLVFLDIEVNDRPQKLLQFGAIKLKQNGEIEEKNWFSNPKCKISNHVFNIVKTNIKNIRNGKSNKEVAKQIYDFLQNCVFISYSPFDYNFLSKLIKKHLNKSLTVHFIDMQEEWKKISLSKNVLALDKLANIFYIDCDKKKLHDAFYDAQILFEIFKMWQSSKSIEIIDSIYNNRIKEEKLIKRKQNKSDANAITINNSTKDNGLVFLEWKFQQKLINEKKESFLTSLSVLEIQANTIKRNWSFYEDINNKFFDIYFYENKIVNVLKDFIISIRNKKIIIEDNNYHSLIKLANLCANKIHVFPINKIIFCNGFNNFYSEINLGIYKYSQNLELIKKWKVFEYLCDKYNTKS